jgi:hypothetical protein
MANPNSPLRYYELQYMLEGLFTDLSGTDMKIGGFNMVAALTGWLWKFHFEQKQTLDAKSLVKTLDDVYTSICEEMVQVQKDTGIQIFTQVEPDEKELVK